jgi:S-sulfo-L-cysteine synthase (O-acetyl-L-serine-dependent)
MYPPHTAPVAPKLGDSSTGGPSHLAEDRLGPVGNTPLLRLAGVGKELPGGVELWAKAEFLNPTGSVKDRAAYEIVRVALGSGVFRPGQTLLDASSGNTGISYAMLGARLGFPVTICLPRNASPERIRRLGAYGAEVVFTDPAEGTDGAQRQARRMASDAPAQYFYADQYNNPANPEAHFRTTGPEIWEQTGGRVTHLVAGVGTGGTISGIGRFLKSQSPAMRVTGVEPDSAMHGIEGLKHIPTALRPGTYEAQWVDETVRVGTEEAQSMARRLAREEGLFLGTSSGAAVAGSLALANRYSDPAVLVTVLPDGGDRYLADRYWEEAP